MRKLFFLLVWILVGTSAQNTAALLDAYMQGQANLYHFNCNVLVPKNGQIIYQKSFGYANYATLAGREFEVYSVTWSCKIFQVTE